MTEERITLIICERQLAPEGLMDLAETGSVRQVVLSSEEAEPAQVGGGTGLRLVANAG